MKNDKKNNVLDDKIMNTIINFFEAGKQLLDIILQQQIALKNTTELWQISMQQRDSWEKTMREKIKELEKSVKK